MACASDSGHEGPVNPPSANPGDDDSTVVYSGPSPSTADAQNFKENLWDNLTASNRCGSCHVEGDQPPYFVRRDDINLAFAAANEIVDLEDPPNSFLVSKVATGHHCWTDNVGFCEERITEWITSWATDSGIELTDADLQKPLLMDVSASLSFDSGDSAFNQYVYPLLRAHCADCHRADAPQAPVQPYFSSSDTSRAFVAAQTAMSFDVTEIGDGTADIDASRSRLVVRLGEESHNCWNDSCSNSAVAMEQALESFAATLEMRAADSTLVTSKALTIDDGTAISQGGRVETNAIAIYPFKAGAGNIANDYSDGFPPQLDLQVSGDVEWVGNWGLRFNNGRAQAKVDDSAKLRRYISQTGEYSIETWAVPADVTQEGPARIVSYSGSDTARNFTLGQTLYSYDFFNRSSTTNVDGRPLLSTPDADEILQPTLQHVVASFDPVEGRKLYVNGQLAADSGGASDGGLADWDDTFALILGSETSGMYPWRGTIRFLAIHNRALTPEQVNINYGVGVGQKILLAFSVAEHIPDMDDAYIVFQVEQFDEYSYLFSEPYFFSFAESVPTDIEIEGLRIGVNGREAAVGQAFAGLKFTVPSGEVGEQGIPLSRLGAIIELEKGSEQDQFFLSFDRIGQSHYKRLREVFPVATGLEDLPPRSDTQEEVGVRMFAAIHASFSAMTGIPQTHPGVDETYQTVQQQMPTVDDIRGFLVAHQMGITQLAVKYCNILAVDDTRRRAFFPDFTGQFNSAGREAVVEPLLQALLAHTIDSEGAQLATQPPGAEIHTDLNYLIDTMTASCSTDTCPDAVTHNTITAVCAAALGSAMMLVQ